MLFKLVTSKTCRVAAATSDYVWLDLHLLRQSVQRTNTTCCTNYLVKRGKIWGCHCRLTAECQSSNPNGKSTSYLPLMTGRAWGESNSAGPKVLLLRHFFSFLCNSQSFKDLRSSFTICQRVNTDITVFKNHRRYHNFRFDSWWCHHVWISQTRRKTVNSIYRRRSGKCNFKSCYFSGTHYAYLTKSVCARGSFLLNFIPCVIRTKLLWFVGDD